jgi:transcriptional regulator GlxA family with amidase domain
LILVAAAQPVRTLDIVPFLDAFNEANRVARTGSEYDVRVVSGGADRSVTSRGGFSMLASVTYQGCFDLADTLLVAGTDDCVATSNREQFLGWLRWQASQSRRIGVVSSGALLLAEAGLLNGRRVTTHWQSHDALATRYPRVLLERNVIYVRDGNLYTCAGATAGLDLALSMIEEDLGPSLAMEVAQSMLLSFRRSGDAAQISAALRAQAVPGSPIADLLIWLPDHLQEDLSIKSLARRSAMSPRNFARIFRRQAGLTPAKHVENLRLEAAQFQLESSELTVEGIAFATGFENGETLRRLFVRRLGLTPGRYRAMKTRCKQDVQASRGFDKTAPPTPAGEQLAGRAENRCSA